MLAPPHRRAPAPPRPPPGARRREQEGRGQRHARGHVQLLHAGACVCVLEGGWPLAVAPGTGARSPAGPVRLRRGAAAATCVRTASARASKACTNHAPAARPPPPPRPAPPDLPQGGLPAAVRQDRGGLPRGRREHAPRAAQGPGQRLEGRQEWLGGARARARQRMLRRGQLAWRAFARLAERAAAGLPNAPQPNTIRVAQVEVLWVVNNRLGSWEAQLPPETRDLLAMNRCVCMCVCVSVCGGGGRGYVCALPRCAAPSRRSHATS